MIVIRTVAQMQSWSLECRKAGRRIGLVPTMGYLHRGHLSLVEASQRENDRTVVSIYVNPTQFSPQEDLARYPRDIDRDHGLLEGMQVDVLFYPDDQEMYPAGHQTSITVEVKSQGLCGAKRPGHFRGVATIVAKLFNCVVPDHAYFGRKDYQQAQVIAQMVKDLNFPLSVRVCPIVREADGLAMSSRNAYLSPEERQLAPRIYASLQQAATGLTRQGLTWDQVRNQVRHQLEQESGMRIDYLELVDADTLEPANGGGARMVMVAAVFLGKTRLLDNILIES
ncbi:MAG: pantoate--beta-alanine ligase [Candidatus Delongbacteria bacterium]|nr:pantoate--beta-alanine ligase [Candidatus Delongbacteria bacterium]